MPFNPLRGQGHFFLSNTKILLISPFLLFRLLNISKQLILFASSLKHHQWIQITSNKYKVSLSVYLMATPTGALPTETVAITAFELVSITDTSLLPKFVT